VHPASGQDVTLSADSESCVRQLNRVLTLAATVSSLNSSLRRRAFGTCQDSRRLSSGTIILNAEGGRLPSSARKERARRGNDVKGAAAPGLRPPLQSPPFQVAKVSVRSTRNDIEPDFRARDSARYAPGVAFRGW